MTFAPRGEEGRRTDEAAGLRMGGYLCLEEIGQGGNGIVYRARDMRMGREVAVKVLRTGATSQTEEKLRFEREAASSARLEHPEIVPIYEFHSQAERPLPVQRAGEPGAPRSWHP